MKRRYEHFGYAHWEIEALVEHLNEMSKKGWQLDYIGKHFMRYTRDDRALYRYQADLRDEIEDEARYLDTFREQGWEPVEKSEDIKEVRYFRKVWDPALPEAEYEIYTDWESQELLIRHMRRYAKELFFACVVVLAIVAVIMYMAPTIMLLSYMLTLLALGAEAVRSIRNLRRVQRREKMRRPAAGRILRALAVVGILAAWLGDVCLEPALRCIGGTGKVEEVFEVRFPDWQRVRIKHPHDAPVKVWIYTGDGELKYTMPEGEREDYAFLMPGEYTLRAERENERARLDVWLH